MNNKIAELGFTFNPVKNNQGQIVHDGTDRIGDRLVFSSLPEMICKQRGYDYVVDLDPNGKNWFWDHNPYVKRGEPVKSTIPLQLLADKTTFHHNLKNMNQFFSIVDKYCSYFGLDCTIRHPKLYMYENIAKKPFKVIITTQGNLQGHMNGETFDRVIPDHILEKIKENYEDGRFELVQIGSKNDKSAGKCVIDKRGLSIWDSVKEVAESMIYIGVNTGVFHIASAFPHISKKIILCEYNDISLRYYLPLNPQNHHTSFLYHAEQFYNSYDRDIGVTTSYLKI